MSVDADFDDSMIFFALRDYLLLLPRRFFIFTLISIMLSRCCCCHATLRLSLRFSPAFDC